MDKYRILGPEKQTGTAEWRHLFNPEELKAAADPKVIAAVSIQEHSYNSANATGTVTEAPTGARNKGRNYSIRIINIPSRLGEEWQEYCFS